MQENISDIFTYMHAWSEQLGQRILQEYPALHRFEDPVSPGVDALLRRPFPAQSIAIMGVAKRWQEARTANVVAECGTGKTLISLGAIHVHSNGHPYTALAMVPPHLVEKWAREAFLTIPGIRVFLIDDMRNGGDEKAPHEGQRGPFQARGDCAGRPAHIAERPAIEKAIRQCTRALAGTLQPAGSVYCRPGTREAGIFLAARLPDSPLRAVRRLAGESRNWRTGIRRRSANHCGGFQAGEIVGKSRYTRQQAGSQVPQPALTGRPGKDSPHGADRVHRTLHARLVRLRHL